MVVQLVLLKSGTTDSPLLKGNKSSPMYLKIMIMVVLQTYRGLCLKTVSNCLISNIFFSSNNEKMDDMTCTELNQFTSDDAYKVITYKFSLL